MNSYAYVINKSRSKFKYYVFMLFEMESFAAHFYLLNTQNHRQKICTYINQNEFMVVIVGQTGRREEKFTKIKPTEKAPLKL